MPFGVVSGFSRGMCILDRCGYRRRGRNSFGGKWEHPTVTNGMAVIATCSSQITFGRTCLLSKCDQIKPKSTTILSLLEKMTAKMHDLVN